MRLKLGLLQDPAVIERQIQKEIKEAETRRQKAAMPTVKTEAQTKADEEAFQKAKKDIGEHVKAAQKPPRIRPLSEAKAIESGANFISEAFLFLVAGGLIVFESVRRNRKEKKQDADISERLEILEREREELKGEVETLKGELSTIISKKPSSGGAKASKKAPTTTSPVEVQPKENADGPRQRSHLVPIATRTSAGRSGESKAGDSSWFEWISSPVAAFFESDNNPSS